MPHGRPPGPGNTGAPRVRVRDERGQGFLEYGLMLAIAALVAVVALVFFHDQINALLNAFAH